MNMSRLFLHPLIRNPRSRSLLLSFAVSIAGVTVFLWIKMYSVLTAAGLNFEFFRSMSSVPLLRLLLSPGFEAVLFLVSVLVAAATTAVSIVGPVRRLEQWLMDWDMGYTLSPLKSRTGDSYDNLIRLINDLYMIKKRPKVNDTPEAQ